MSNYCKTSLLISTILVICFLEFPQQVTQAFPQDETHPKTQLEKFHVIQREKWFDKSWNEKTNDFTKETNEELTAITIHTPTNEDIPVDHNLKDKTATENIKAIYKKQALTDKLGDIAFNFIIDESGKIYEGRIGSAKILSTNYPLSSNKKAALIKTNTQTNEKTTQLMNTKNTISILVLNNFNEENTKLLQSLGKLSAKLLNKHNIKANDKIALQKIIPTRINTGTTQIPVIHGTCHLQQTCKDTKLYESIKKIIEIEQNQQKLKKTNQDKQTSNNTKIALVNKDITFGLFKDKAQAYNALSYPSENPIGLIKKATSLVNKENGYEVEVDFGILDKRKYWAVELPTIGNNINPINYRKYVHELNFEKKIFEKTVDVTNGFPNAGIENLATLKIKLETKQVKTIKFVVYKIEQIGQIKTEKNVHTLTTNNEGVIEIVINPGKYFIRPIEQDKKISPQEEEINIKEKENYIISFKDATLNSAQQKPTTDIKKTCKIKTNEVAENIKNGATYGLFKQETEAEEAANKSNTNHNKMLKKITSYDEANIENSKENETYYLVQLNPTTQNKHDKKIIKYQKPKAF